MKIEPIIPINPSFFDLKQERQTLISKEELNKLKDKKLSDGEANTFGRILLTSIANRMKGEK
jgi:hypothetical protein